MRASHDRASVVKSVTEVLRRARGLRLTSELAIALGATLHAQWPSAMTVEEGTHFFQGMHADLVLNDELISERANNIASVVIALEQAA